MAKRARMGRYKSKKVFRRGSKIHGKNLPRAPMRGGIRL